jgi:hypothetical protein
MMSVGQSVEWELAGETEVLGENLPQCHFVNHKSHTTWPGLEPGRRGGKPVSNRLSYGTASLKVISRISLEESDENHEKRDRRARWLDRGSNYVRLEMMFTVLPLYHPLGQGGVMASFGASDW